MDNWTINIGHSNDSALNTSWTLILLLDLPRETYDVDDHQDESFPFFSSQSFLLSNDTQPKVADTYDNQSRFSRDNPIPLTIDNRDIEDPKGTADDPYIISRKDEIRKGDKRKQQSRAEQQEGDRCCQLCVWDLWEQFHFYCLCVYAMYECLSMPISVWRGRKERRQLFLVYCPGDHFSFLSFSYDMKSNSLSLLYYICVTNHISSFCLHQCK